VTDPDVTEPGVTATTAGMTSTRSDRVGWYFYSWANHGYLTVAATVFLGPYLTSLAKLGAGCAAGADCRGGFVHPLGIPVAAGSYFPYLVTVGTILTVLIVPVVGAIADRSKHKKRLLIGCAYVGAAATSGLALVPARGYLFAGLLFLLTNIALQVGAVIQNSWLPLLAGTSRRDTVSSVGFAVGYIGGAVLLSLSLVAVQVDVGGSALAAARVCIFAAGVWWAGFTVVPVVLLRNRELPAFDKRQGNTLSEGFHQLGRTLRELVRRYPLTVFFLVAFLVYNDGIQTVLSQASVYGTNQLKLNQNTLVTTILIVQFVAFGGALLLGRLAVRIGARTTVLACLVLWIGVVIGAFWLPVGAALPFLGLGVLIGLVVGGSQALSRSLFSQLIPAGREAEYFGIYAIGDLGTSWIGTLLFGLVYQFTFNYRLGIVSLLVFFCVGFVLLLLVPIRRAVIAVGNTPPRHL
jgi:UMF1 family MFS transporter